MRKNSNVHAALRDAMAAHKQMGDAIDKAMNYLADDGYGSHDQIQGAPTTDRSGAFHSEGAPGAGASHPGKLAGKVVQHPNGDRDLDEEGKKTLAKAIYSNPLAVRPRTVLDA